MKKKIRYLKLKNYIERPEEEDDSQRKKWYYIILLQE